MRVVFVEGIDLSIYCTTRRWWADNREITLEGPDQQAQPLLNLQGGHQKAAEKKGQWTKVMCRSTKGHMGRKKPRCAVAV